MTQTQQTESSDHPNPQELFEGEGEQGDDEILGPLLVTRLTVRPTSLSPPHRPCFLQLRSISLPQHTLTLTCTLVQQENGISQADCKKLQEAGL